MIANLTSGVEDKKYSDVEFGYVKFVYRVRSDKRLQTMTMFQKQKKLLLKSMKLVKLMV